jgi:hypothetical protein
MTDVPEATVSTSTSLLGRLNGGQPEQIIYRDMVATMFSGLTSSKGDPASGNISMGYLSMQNVADDPFNVYYNIGVGAYTLNSLTTGFANIAIGGEALFSITTGFGNIGIGHGVLATGTTAFENIGIGDASLEIATTAQANVAIGRHTLEKVTTGTYNVALGDETGRNFPVTGSGNTMLGRACHAGTAAAVDRIVIGHPRRLHSGDHLQLRHGSDVGRAL